MMKTCIEQPINLLNSNFLLGKNSDNFMILSKLMSLEKAKECAERISNFFENNWTLITDPTSYQKNYRQLYSGINDHQPLYAYELYDIYQIKAPYIENGILIYYVEENNLPYKISCKISCNNKEIKVDQELLNIWENNVF